MKNSSKWYLPSFDIELKSFLAKKCHFYTRITFLLVKSPKFSISNDIQGFMTFLLLHFVFLKGGRWGFYNGSTGSVQQPPSLYLWNWWNSLSEKWEGHKNGQNSAIKSAIQENASNDIKFTNYKNLFGVKRIFESIQRFLR